MSQEEHSKYSRQSSSTLVDRGNPTAMLTPDFGTCQGGVLRRRKGSTLYDRWIWRGNRVPRSKILLTEGEGVDQIFFGFGLARVILFLEVVFIP